MNIIILDSRHNSYVRAPDLEQACLGQGVQVRLYHVDSVDQLPDEALECDGIISWHLVPLGKDALARFRRCHAIVRAAVGFDNIDLAYARNRQIEVANVPDYGTEEVADHTLALALGLLRKLKAGDRVVRSGSWDWREVGDLPRLRDLPVGILGMGRIGTAVALRFKAFGCQVSFFDPQRPSGWEKSLGVTRVESLEALLDSSALVSIHAPLTPHTHHLISHDSLARLRGKYLINTARGAIVDPDALASAMAHDTLRGLGLDVHADESQLPPEVLMGENVIWTPHVAFYSDQALNDLRTKAAECLRTLLHNDWHRNIVN